MKKNQLVTDIYSSLLLFLKQNHYVSLVYKKSILGCICIQRLRACAIVFDLQILKCTRCVLLLIASLCSDGRWRCTAKDCDSEILCPGELIHRTDMSDCNSTCEGLDNCNPDAPLRSGCACPYGLVLHPLVNRYIVLLICSFCVPPSPISSFCFTLKGKKVKECIAVNGTPSHSYGTSLAIWDHAVLPATRDK